MAGLNVCEILDEPLAALYHVDSISDLAGNNVLVFDLGGGTLDLVVAEVTEEKITEAFIGGDESLGGSDWDKAFASHIKETYLGGKTLSPEQEQELLLSAEKAKIILSQKEQTRITVMTMEGRIPVVVTRSEFEQCTKFLVKKIGAAMATLIHDTAVISLKTGHYYFNYDKIILVGGATRMPQIEHCLRGFFKSTPIIIKDQDEAVAKGAAIYAKILSETQQGSRRSADGNSFRPKSLRRISARNYGLGAIQKESGEEKVCNMIFRYDYIPAVQKSVFATQTDNVKNLKLAVYENTSDNAYADIESSRMLGSCTLELEDNLPKGSAIEVSFDMEADGILTIEGREPKLGSFVKAVMESEVLFDSEELEEQRKVLEELKKGF